MKALVLLGGQPPSVELLMKRARLADIVVCCDAGARLAVENGLKIDLLVGDFDSLGLEEARAIAAKTGCQLQILPEKKDLTDGQAGVDGAIALGAASLCMLGGLGGRMDHTLGNIQLLVRCRHKGAEAVLEDDLNQIRVTCTALGIRGSVGDTVTLLPMDVNTRIRATAGLEYPLFDAPLPMGGSLGVSNVLTCELAVVEVEHGWVCVVQSK